MTRLRRYSSSTFAILACSHRTSLRKQRAHQGTSRPPVICILSLWWFIKLSRDERPVGRGLAFAPGDVATRNRYPRHCSAAFASSDISSPHIGRRSLAAGPLTGAIPDAQTASGSGVGERCTGFPRSAVEALVRLGTRCRPMGFPCPRGGIVETALLPTYLLVRASPEDQPLWLVRP